MVSYLCKLLIRFLSSESVRSSDKLPKAFCSRGGNNSINFKFAKLKKKLAKFVIITLSNFPRSFKVYITWKMSEISQKYLNVTTFEMLFHMSTK